MIEAPSEPIDPSTWSPWKRYRARQAARKLLAMLRDQGLDAESLAKAQAVLDESGLMGPGD